MDNASNNVPISLHPQMVQAIVKHMDLSTASRYINVVVGEGCELESMSDEERWSWLDVLWTTLVALEDTKGKIVKFLCIPKHGEPAIHNYSVMRTLSTYWKAVYILTVG